MLNRITIINSNLKPESLYVAKHTGVVIVDPIPSQAFLFGEFNMAKSKFRRKKKVLGKCKWCGENAFYQFGTGNLCCKSHYNKCPIMRKKSSKIQLAFGDEHHSKKPEAKKNMSKAQKGKKLSKETRDKIAKSIKALDDKHPMKNPEIAKKASEKNKGRKRSKEFCKMRSKIQATKCGPLAPGWKGGISNEPYCSIWSDKEYKQDIRDRDNHTCQNPDCWKNCDNNGEKLCIHHINENKLNCHPWNLISLCRSCNIRAEGNKKENISREYWQNLYQNIMTEKYDYNYKQIGDN